MKNVIIYTDKKSSSLADVISGIEDVNVRLESAENIKDYEALNPGVVIVESVPDIKDVLMVTKFKYPLLFIGETFKGATVRAVGAGRPGHPNEAVFLSGSGEAGTVCQGIHRQAVQPQPGKHCGSDASGNEDRKRSGHGRTL